MPNNNLRHPTLPKLFQCLWSFMGTTYIYVYSKGGTNTERSLVQDMQFLPLGLQFFSAIIAIGYIYTVPETPMFHAVQCKIAHCRAHRYNATSVMKCDPKISQDAL